MNRISKVSLQDAKRLFNIGTSYYKFPNGELPHMLTINLTFNDQQLRSTLLFDGSIRWITIIPSKLSGIVIRDRRRLLLAPDIRKYFLLYTLVESAETCVCFKTKKELDTYNQKLQVWLNKFLGEYVIKALERNKRYGR